MPAELSIRVVATLVDSTHVLAVDDASFKTSERSSLVAAHVLVSELKTTRRAALAVTANADPEPLTWCLDTAAIPKGCGTRGAHRTDAIMLSRGGHPQGLTSAIVAPSGLPI